MSLIHQTAIVSPKAEIGADVEIGPNAFIGDNVTIGRGTRVYANAYIDGHTIIGEENEIHMGAVIGHDPQDFAFDRAIRSYVEIGNKNVIREYCTIHRGTKPETSTTIGNENFLMGGAHLAHNVSIGNNVILANYVLLGGYVTIGDRAFISGAVGVHQFCTIGRLAMVSGGARISRDIPPFVMAVERNATQAVNLVGLRRAGLSKEAIQEVKKAYSILYLSGFTRQKAIKELNDAGFVSSEAAEFIDFVKNTKKPLVMHRGKSRRDE